MKIYPDHIAAVDIGNSTVKVYKVDFDHPTDLICVRLNTLEEASKRLPSLPGDVVAFLSTRELTEEERCLVKERGWWEFTSQTPVPIEVIYDRSTLGPDRLALALACSSIVGEEGALVVDVGSALTLDVVTCSGEFYGGNISPGMRMRFKALSEYTSRLPLVKSGNVTQRFGKDTHNAILSGVMLGLVSEIACAYLDAERIFEISNIVFTGGDAEYLEDAVVDEIYKLNGRPRRMIDDEALIGMGLIEAYIYNHEQDI